MNANSELPHPYPSSPYSCGAKSGKAKPAILLRNVMLATALAAYLVYESMTYV
jgi:hypothetical protein